MWGASWVIVGGISSENGNGRFHFIVYYKQPIQPNCIDKERTGMSYLTRLFSLTLFLTLSLSGCGLQDSLPTVEMPDDWRDQGAVAATRAAEAMATAAAQGGDSLATAQAAGIIPAIDSDYLKERAARVQPDGSGAISLTFTDSEINQAIQLMQQVTAQTGQPVLIHEPQTRFASGLITISGRVTQPTTTSASFVFRPYVSDNTLQFEVVHATVGNSNAPGPIRTQVESLLNRTLGGAVSNLPIGFTLQNVIVGEGMITVVARR